MREILFKGKRKDNGEWVEGDLIQNGLFYETAIRFTDDAGYFITAIVDPETVGQFTGLTANGKKIFEGDLLNGFDYPFRGSNGKHNYFAEVCWFDNCPAFGLYTHKYPNAEVWGISEGNTENMEDFDGNDWEVIGNIHDNPELLKDGE